MIKFPKDAQETLELARKEFRKNIDDNAWYIWRRDPYANNCLDCLILDGQWFMGKNLPPCPVHLGCLCRVERVK